MTHNPEILTSLDMTAHIRHTVSIICREDAPTPVFDVRRCGQHSTSLEICQEPPTCMI